MNAFIQNVLNGNVTTEKIQYIMTNEKSQPLKSYKKMSDEDWIEELKITVFLQTKESKFNMDLLGKKMNISRRQLQRKIKKITGFSPKIYIKELRLKESLRLLKMGEVSSVKEAALMVGFISTEYFSVQFKKRFGIVPSSVLKS